MEPLRLCIVGDALLDVDWEGDVREVCRDAPAPVLDTPTERIRPGGAALAAVLGVTAGVEVILVTALAGDDDGRRLMAELDAAGVHVVDLGLDGPTPVKLRLRSGGQSLARVDRGCDPVVPPGPMTSEARAALSAADVVLVSDYGRGMATLPGIADGTAAAGRPLVWDPHTRGPRPSPRAALVTPNVQEAAALVGRGRVASFSTPALVTLAEQVSRAVGCPVALTAGETGAVLTDGRSLPSVVPTRPVQGDACGAGDRFATSTAIGLGRGEDWRAAAAAAVDDARTYVAGGMQPSARAVSPGLDDGPPPHDRVVALADRADRPGHVDDMAAAAMRVRRAGGVVVATGGCFDVLHAGHVQLLEHARRLGDHLVVCLNSDRSVRRLKGAGRPLNSAADRAAVLRSLAAVDSVVVFDEDTPAIVLDELRPHLFVKGADYQGAEIAEQSVLARWGGHVVLVPLVEGRSTTDLIASAASAGA